MPRLTLNAAAFCLMLILTSFTLTGCSNPEEITIGAVLGLTTGKGESLPISIEVLKGMELAVESINENTGSSDFRIRLVYRDSTLDPVAAQIAFREIANQSPKAIITMYSHLSKALAPLATELKMPQLAIMSTDDSILDNSPFTFRYWPSASTEAQAILPIIKKLKVKKLGIVNIDNGYGNAVTRELVRLLNEHGIKNDNVRYTEIDKDLKQRMSYIKGCDAIQLTCFPEDMVEMVSLIREACPGKPLIGPNGITSPIFSSNPVFEGVYVNAPLIYNPNYPFAANIAQKFLDKYGTRLSRFSAIGFDSINLLVQLIRKGDTSRESVKTKLESAFVYPGIFGDVVKENESHDFSFPLYPARILSNSVIYQDR